MKAIIDQCDTCPTLDGRFPAILRLVDGSQRSATIELWRNPVTGEAEPFLPLYVGEDGRIERPSIERIHIHLADEPSYPDWGGFGDDEMLAQAHDTAAPIYLAGGLLLFAAVLIWQLVERLGR